VSLAASQAESSSVVPRSTLGVINTDLVIL
jgi:hypothetical protein